MGLSLHGGRSLETDGAGWNRPMSSHVRCMHQLRHNIRAKSFNNDFQTPSGSPGSHQPQTQPHPLPAGQELGASAANVQSGDWQPQWLTQHDGSSGDGLYEPPVGSLDAAIQQLSRFATGPWDRRNQDAFRRVVSRAPANPVFAVVECHEWLPHSNFGTPGQPARALLCAATYDEVLGGAEYVSNVVSMVVFWLSPSGWPTGVLFASPQAYANNTTCPPSRIRSRGFAGGAKAYVRGRLVQVQALLMAAGVASDARKLRGLLQTRLEVACTRPGALATTAAEAAALPVEVPEAAPRSRRGRAAASMAATQAELWPAAAADVDRVAAAAAVADRLGAATAALQEAVAAASAAAQEAAAAAQTAAAAAQRAESVLEAMQQAATAGMATSQDSP